MSMNWPPTHPGLLGWSNAQLVSDSNTDNASLNQQLTASIAPWFAPASRTIVRSISDALISCAFTRVSALMGGNYQTLQRSTPLHSALSRNL